MAINLGKLTAQITADSTGFTAGVTRAIGTLGEFQAAASNLGTRITEAFSGITAAISAVGVTAGIARAISQMDRLQDTAEQIGVSAGKLHSLAGAADQSGTSLEAVAKAMAKISKDTGGGDPLVLLQGVAAKVAAARSPAEALAIAMKKLGKAGAQLVPFLRELNDNPPLATLDDKRIKQVADLADAWARIKHSALTITVNAMTLGGEDSVTKIIDDALQAISDPVGTFGGRGGLFGSSVKELAHPTSPLVLAQRKEKRIKRDQLGARFFDAVAGPFLQGLPGKMAGQYRLGHKEINQQVLGPTMSLLRFSAAGNAAQQRRTDFRGEALERGSAAANQAITQLMNQHNDKQLAVQIQSKDALHNLVNILGGLAGNLGLAQL